MFALRSLGKMVWGSKESPEAYKIDTGVLYEVRPDTRVPRKCLFKDAELVIRRTTVPFNYQLVAVRVFEEGEEDLADNGQALDDERAFLIGAELRFTSATIDNAAGFKWEDASGVPRVYYEFVSDAGSVTAEKRSQFALAVARCAWERQNRESYTAADPEEIDRIVTMVEDEELEQILMNAKIDDEELGAMEQPVPEKNPKKSRQPSGPQLPAPPRKMKAGDITLSVLGGLYIFDPSKTEFVMVAPEVTLAVVNPAKYEYWINVVSDECKYLSQVIDPGMNAVFNHDYRSLIWNYFDANGKAYSFSLVADDDEHYDTMHQGMTRAAYETLNQEPWKKATVSAQDYMLDAYEEDVAMPTAPEEWDGSEGSEEETEE
ncbi:Vacuolar import and degradation protein 27, partial [Linderina macrospora]